MSSTPSSKSGAFRRPSRKVARIAGVGVVAGGLVASAALVWQASYSAFSATTANPGNNWTAGTVTLANDSGSALFTATNLKPGSTGSKCIVVSSGGSLASTVKLYTTATSFSQTNTLGDNLQLTVTQGSTPASTPAGACTGFTADTGATNTASLTARTFSTTYTGFGAGFGTWAPVGASVASPVVKTYKIDYVLNSPATQTAVDAMQGGTAQIGFTWEAQNS